MIGVKRSILASISVALTIGTLLAPVSANAQYSPECNQFREIQRQLVSRSDKLGYNKEENDIISDCGDIADDMKGLSGKSYAQNYAACFLAKCLSGNTTSSCVVKTDLLQEYTELVSTMRAAYCPPIYSDGK